MFEADEGFLHAGTSSAKPEVCESVCEVITGLRAPHWSPKSVDERPPSIQTAEGDGGHFIAMDIITRRLSLDQALRLAHAFNNIQLRNGGELWAVVYLKGDSPLNLLDFGGRLQ